MELTETIANINKGLKESFGIDTISTDPIWRVVWSEDQFEWRKGIYDDITSGGIFLRSVEEIRYVPKYRQWISEKFVLERLVIIPEMNEGDLPSTRVSYEPIWVYEDKDGNYLPPKLEAAKFIINTIYASQYGTGNLKKYHDPESSQEAELETRKKRVDGIVEELFGEQSSLAGTTKTGESIIVPRNYERN